LTAINPELEQSARASGAGWLQTMRFVIVPLVMPAIVAACARFFSCKPFAHETMLPSLQGNEIGTSELDPFRSSILGPCSPL
jgi:ABC-type spermidine/putrescine transport system permease subunit I